MASVDSWEQVGSRLREARIAAGFSQGQLAGQLGIDRSALVRIESGQRQVSALELFRLSEILGVPVAHFVSTSPAAIVSLRADLDDDAQPAARERYRFDAMLEAHARDADFLHAQGYLPAGRSLQSPSVTESFEARQLALTARRTAGFGIGPLPGIAQVADTFGLYLLVLDLPGEGASLRLDDDQFGVAVIGGRAPAGRRRFTAAHELGHHLLGDEYQTDIGVAASSDEREALIDTFAAEFLLPESETASQWEQLSGTPRERLVKLAASFRVSWSVAVRAVARCGALDADEARLLRAQAPQRGDFLAICGVEPTEDLVSGQTSPMWRRAVLAAYRDGVVTPERTVELLHGALDEADLPDRNGQSEL